MAKRSDKSKFDGTSVITTSKYASFINTEDSDQLAVLIDVDKIVPYHRENMMDEDGHVKVFRDYDEDKLSMLADNIEHIGLMEPIVVFKSLVTEDRYEVLAGKQRTGAYRLLHARHPESDTYKQIKAVVIDSEEASKNEYALADLVFVGTNLYRRTELSISERAQAYEMQFNALSHQGREAGAESHKIIADREGIKVSEVRCLRKILPQNFTEEFLEMIDQKKISMTMAARNISAIGKANQHALFEWALSLHSSRAEAERYLSKQLKGSKLVSLKQLAESKDEVLTTEEIESIFKPEPVRFKAPSPASLQKIIPVEYWSDDPNKVLSFLELAIKAYNEHHE